MEDKRTAIAVLLCIITVMFYSEYVLTPYTLEARRHAIEQQHATQATSAIGQVAPSQTASVVGAPAPAAVSVPTLEEIAAGGLVTIETDLISVTLSKLGGRIERFVLNRYKHHLGSDERYDMVSAASGVPLPLGIYTPTESDARTAYTVASVSTGTIAADDRYSLSAGAPEFRLTLRGTLPSGVGVTKTYSFAPAAYLINVETTLDQPTSSGAPVWLEWTHALDPGEIHARTDTHSFSVLDNDNSIQHVYDDSLSPALTDVGASRWVAYTDRYFIAALIPTGIIGSGMIAKDPGTRAYIGRTAGTASGITANVFIGPKDYRLLKSYTYNLERSVDLGTFTFLAYPLLWLLRAFHDMLGNWGLAIILLTLAIKALFLPLTKASFDSMQAMQQLQPEIKSLRERITDPTQLNREVMELYKRRGVNPVGGCLPVLIQIPVFLGLYNALLNSIELRHAPFALWINDLSSPEHLYVFGIGIPVMVLLMGASMVFQQLTTPSTMDPAQKRIMLMVPIIFTISFVIFPFPAGLVLYWLVNNVISIIQQIYLRSDIKVSPLKATAVASLGIFCFGFVLTLI
jgi:YidC/Oxa1 family membrane protein insertase